MKRLLQFSMFVLLMLFYFQPAYSQGTEKDYQNAEKFLHFNVYKMTKNIHLWPVWINNSNKFWFKKQTQKGYEFIKVTPSRNRVEDAFNHKRLASALAKQLNKTVNSDSLPFRWFEYSKDEKSITFKIDTINYKYSLRKNILSVVTKQKDNLKKNESKSPDGKWIVSVKKHNLYIRDTKSGIETPLTKDGITKCDYATPLSWYKFTDESVGDTYDPTIDITWSSDSKHFVTYKQDRRETGKLYLLQTMPDSGMKAKVWSYERSLPGEKASTFEYYIFDVISKEKVKVDVKPFATFCSNVNPTFTDDNKQVYFSRFTRGYKSSDVFLIDVNSGKVNSSVHDSSKTMVEYQMAHSYIVSNGEKVIYTSERDGWNHLYLFDGKTGKLINQITKGEFVVRGIEYVDEKNGVIYFTAGGKEPNRDPYYKHLYKVNFDGSGFKLLTPEDAEHEVTISPDGKYFIDNFSRVDLAPVCVLRKLKSGKLVNTLLKADISELLKTGWRYPERFVTKARDGKTNLYGVIFYPSTFSPKIKYPILDNTYSGPQAVNVPKSFRRGIWNDAQPLAEIGFVVIKIDGLGTAMRSKKFHDFSYQNLGDIGALDHIYGIKQLAVKYSFIDTSRVGIYGYSAGGYDATHAMLTHPEFYKVGVAGAGNHDQRMAKAWWPEQYMGMPGKYYAEQSNITIANNLKGKLLLVHGDMDNNVNPECSYRLAAEFIKYNKDFDMIIVPNNNHSKLWGNKYFIRKRMDYFVKNLWHINPPKEFQFHKYN